MWLLASDKLPVVGFFGNITNSTPRLRLGFLLCLVLVVLFAVREPGLIGPSHPNTISSPGLVPAVGWASQLAAANCVIFYFEPGGRGFEGARARIWLHCGSPGIIDGGG